MMERNFSLTKICIAYLLVWTISPPLSIDLIYRLIAVLCALVFALDEIMKHGYSLTREEGYSVLFLLVIVLVVLYANGVGGVLKPIALYLLVIAYIIYNRYKDNLSVLNGLQIIAIALLFVWNIQTIRALSLDDRIARMIVRNDVEIYQYLRRGVGGYGHIICQTILSPVAIAWTLSAFRQHKVKFILGVVYLISFFRVLFSASYAIPILATVIGIIVYFTGKKTRMWSYIVLALIIAGLTIYLIGYVPAIREYLGNLFPGYTVQNKINDLMYSIETGEMQGDFAARLSRYLTPIRSFFFEHPLVGGLWKGGAAGHSTILDAFGQYGLFGGYMMCSMLFFVPRRNRSKYFENRKIRRTTAAVWVVLFVTMMFDAWSLTCSFILFLVIPLMLEDIRKWGRTKANRVISGERI